MYTDGLVERRRSVLDEGITRVADLLEGGRAAELDDLADHIMTSLTPAGGYQDDVVLLLYRHPGPLEMKFPADLTELAATRKALRGWLSRVGIDSDQTMSLLVASGEAVANAIEHGHRHDPGGTVSFSACALTDRIQMTITDTGRWKPKTSSSDSHRGRGIALMRALMDEVTIGSDEAGTTVNLSTGIL
jgi:anti-sigma regulatory factor (Ser/Thr protein kinase)